MFKGLVLNSGNFLKVPCMFKTRAFAFLGIFLLIPITLSIAAEKNAVPNTAATNPKTAGQVVEYDIKDFSEAKKIFIGVFDIFGSDNSDFTEETETEAKKTEAKQKEKPKPATIFKKKTEKEIILSLPSVAVTEPPKPSLKTLIMGKGPLSDHDAQIYKAIFTLQTSGDMKKADNELIKLKDLRLRGPVLYQRYMHPTSYISSFDELRNWMALYSDHPGASRIYKLALRKKPSSFDGFIEPPQKIKSIARRREPMIYHGQNYKSPRKRSSAQKRNVINIGKSTISLVNRNRLTQAYKELSSSEISSQLDDVEFDNLRARIAEGFLHMGKTEKAFELASVSADRSKRKAPLAAWISGLVAWGNGDYDKAAHYFEFTAKSSYASSWTAAAGAFWTARSNMRAGKSSQTKLWLKEAMNHPRTFYGLVATRAMGRGFTFNWDFPTFTKDHNALLLKTAQGVRAMALVAAGQIHLAESELLRLNPKTKDLQEALLAYAGHAGLPALALRAGSAFEGPNGIYYDAALYPKGNWKPKEDYIVDPDLVHAIMRQESKFDSRAESPSGALGLMQLMPSTASYVAGKKHLKSRAGQELLLEPHMNLDLGEKYILNLLKNKYVSGDLISMLIAYNAGPGNLKRWQNQWGGIDDPLLFIELIPSRQTRAYVERVLSNYWIYRFREGLSTPTLDALAKGKNAYYSDAQKAKRLNNPYKVAHNP